MPGFEAQAARPARTSAERPLHPHLETASPRMAAVLETLWRAAPHEVPVLLRGEVGVGKGVLARALHARSGRRERPFRAVACPALGEHALAAALFGSGEGRGALEAAEGGAVLLEGLGVLSPALQARLLRLLEGHQFQRIGEGVARLADVRLMISTDRDLEADAAGGRLLPDLLYRLNVMEVVVPPLRDRPEDLLPLTRTFLRSSASRAGRAAPALSPATEALLRRWPWPGNLRELRNAVERALILSPGATVEPEVFPERMRSSAGAGPALGEDHTIEEIERAHVMRVIARTPTLAEAARILGVDVTTLWRKRRRWGG